MATDRPKSWRLNNGLKKRKKSFVGGLRPLHKFLQGVKSPVASVKAGQKRHVILPQKLLQRFQPSKIVKMYKV